MSARLLLAAAGLLAGTACVPARQAAEGEAVTSAAAAPAVSAGRQLVERKCSTCHGLDVSLSGRRSAAEWHGVVEAMIGHGMVVTDEERRIIEAYLSEAR